MSASLLEKSLRLLDSDSKTKKSLNPKNSASGATGVKKPIKEVKHQFPKKKNNGKRKGKQSIVELVQSKAKEDKTSENLGILDQLSLKKSITQTSADKVVFLSYLTILSTSY